MAECMVNGLGVEIEINDLDNGTYYAVFPDDGELLCMGTYDEVVSYCMRKGFRF